MNTPLISIVIANYNFGRYLEDAIQSVLSQGMGDKVELIICDAQSSDNSVEIIKKYANSIAWWCSERDKGQSDAFNKGFAHAHGQYLTWLNADDIYLPGALKAVERAFLRCPMAEWATGNFVRFNERNKKIIEAAWGPHWVPFMFQGNGFPLSIFGPTVFWSREAYEKIGPIDEALHYTMDSDYWRRLTMAGCKYIRINHDCWAFRMHEESKTAEFDDHSRTVERKAKMQEETRLSMNRCGYHSSRLGSMLKAIMRVFDGSYLRAIWRLVFIVGKNIEEVYNFKLKAKETS